MTEEIAATPGWIDDRLDEVFSLLPRTEPVMRARNEYAACLARRKQPGAPSDMLGAETEPCHRSLLQSLRDEGIDTAGIHAKLESVEAELAEDS